MTVEEYSAKKRGSRTVLLVSLQFNSLQFLTDSSQSLNVSGNLQIFRAQVPAFLNPVSPVALQY